MKKGVIFRCVVSVIILRVLLSIVISFSSCVWSNDSKLFHQETYSEGKYTLFFASNGDGTCTLYDAEGILPATFYVPEKTSNGWLITVLGEGCFSSNCREVINIVIPDSIVSIEYMAFGMGEKIESISFGSGLSKLDSGMFFSGGNNLKKITVSKENAYFVSVDNKCLLDKKMQTLLIGTTSAFIPETVQKIADDAFSYRFFTDSLLFPTSVNEIGSFAFEGCRNVGDLILPENLNILGEACFSDSDVLSVCGGSYQVVPTDAFAYCEKLESIQLPTSVKEISSCAFNIPKNQLSRIHISANVLTIEEYAFYCPNTTICCELEAPPSGWEMQNNFEDCIFVWDCNNSET